MPTSLLHQEHNKKILDSWHSNAAAWIELMQTNAIESRRLVTNRAVVDAVLLSNPRKPQTALDLGCGEGWLARALAERGVQTFGVDAVAELIASAQAHDAANARRYAVRSYDDLIAHKRLFDAEVLPAEAFEVVVINFALFAETETDALLAALPYYLAPNGRIVLQTLHPLVASEGTAYISGWREGSWSGLPGAFVKPYRWYFRTLERWLHSFTQAGLAVQRILEPLHPHSQRPASMLFVLANGLETGSASLPLSKNVRL